MIKGTHFYHLRNPKSWKNSIDALLLNSLSPKKHSPRDLGSPGNLQLLQLQLFSPNFLKFWVPPHDLALLLIVELSSLLGVLSFQVILKIDCRPI